MGPTLVIAGTHSGSGKTSFTVALARLLARRGLAVQTFKVGPDFLDPTWLALASGRPCYNLDGWMAGPDHCRRLFSRAAADADVALIEGVMGLYDGADTRTDEGSTAEIARLLDAPVILVVNAHGMGRSFAALVKGFTAFGKDLSFAGIVANRCGSARHAAWLSDALSAAGQPPLLGAIPRGAFPELPSRHLGLVTADAGRITPALLDAFADALESHIPAEALFTEMPIPAGGAVPPPESGSRPESPASRRAHPDQMSLFSEIDATEKPQRRGTAPRGNPLRIAVARDAAFHFYYQDLFDDLTEAGCELVFFSPLAESRLPEGIAGLYLGGGYPELHAEQLSANAGMIAALRDYAASGRPLYAECGGLILLSRGIEAEGRFCPLAGILPAGTRMLPARRALGYVEVTLRADSLWGGPGDILKGHEFHYSELIDDPAADPAWQKVYTLRRRRTAAVETEGFQNGAILASYAHLHLASRPAAVARFIERCGGTP